jgi:hypothetical protein
MLTGLTGVPIECSESEILMINMLMPVQQITHIIVLLVLTDRGILAIFN